MAVPEKVANRTEEIVAALKESRDLSLGDKDSFIEIMKRACAGCNGLTPDEKLQACAENIANLCYLMIKDKLEGGRVVGFWPHLFRLIERRTWAFVVIALAVIVLVGTSPEIIDRLQSALH
jgi:hypothetical protein